MRVSTGIVRRRSFTVSSNLAFAVSMLGTMQLIILVSTHESEWSEWSLLAATCSRPQPLCHSLDSPGYSTRVWLHSHACHPQSHLVHGLVPASPPLLAAKRTPQLQLTLPKLTHFIPLTKF